MPVNLEILPLTFPPDTDPGSSSVFPLKRYKHRRTENKDGITGIAWSRRWIVVQVRSNQERQLATQLTNIFPPVKHFVPLRTITVKSARKTHKGQQPALPGFLFVHGGDSTLEELQRPIFRQTIWGLLHTDDQIGLRRDLQRLYQALQLDAQAPGVQSSGGPDEPQENTDYLERLAKIPLGTPLEVLTGSLIGSTVYFSRVNRTSPATITATLPVGIFGSAPFNFPLDNLRIRGTP